MQERQQSTTRRDQTPEAGIQPIPALECMCEDGGAVRCRSKPLPILLTCVRFFWILMG